MKRLLLLVGALALGGCLDTTAPTTSDPSKETFAASLGVNLAEMKKTVSGTYFKDITVGTGASLTNPSALTNVTVDYTGYLTSGSQFDTGTDATFPLGNVIFGFVDGMIGMNVGGERLIVIPSELGYANQTRRDANGNVVIPANSTLVFRIKLKAFQTPS